jgi:hypothetical protein
MRCDVGMLRRKSRIGIGIDRQGGHGNQLHRHYQVAHFNQTLALKRQQSRCDNDCSLTGVY